MMDFKRLTLEGYLKIRNNLHTMNTNLFATIIVAVFIIFLLTFKILRSYYVVYVNCWFCNHNAKVSFNKRNQFICPSCLQYNGFKEDGSYNCVIEAQHDVSKNSQTYQVLKSSPKQTYNFENNLCDTCNIQQSLKVRALAEFSSLSEDSNEVEDFKHKLEEMYDLCQQCEATVHQILGKQNSLLKPKLIAWRLLKSKNIKNFVIQKGNLLSNSRGCQLIFSLISLYLVGSKLGSCFWTLPLNVMQNFKVTAYTWLLFIKKMDVLLALIGLLYSCHIFTIGSIKSKVSLSHNLIGWLILVLLHNDVNFNFFYEETSCYLQLFVTLLIFVQSTQSSEKLTKQSISKPMVFTPSIVTSTQTTQSPILNTSGASSKTCRPLSSLASNNQEDKKEEEIGITLNDLKIGTPHKFPSASSTGTGVFSSHFQFPPTKNCHSETSKRNRNILQQSKLSSKITQSSWVAGGYWGESPKRRQPNPQNVPELNNRNDDYDLFSRASSKSSGFVSQASDSNGFFYPQYVDLPNNSRQNLSSRWGNHDEKKSIDSLDAYSVSSCYSTACPTERQQFKDWKSSQCSLYSAQDNSHIMGNISQKHQTETYVNFNWYYIFFAFALGFSLSANIFLIFACVKSDLIFK